MRVIAPASLYDDVPYYGLLFDSRRHDVELYRFACTGARGPVLELGVGTGRIAIALARDGIEVHGVDNSTKMLEELAARLAEEPDDVQRRVRAQRGDASRVALGRRYELVLGPFNVIAHQLTAADLSALTDNVRRHLAPGGAFVLDVHVPEARHVDGARVDIPWFRHPSWGVACRATERLSYDATRHVLTIDTHVRSMQGPAREQSLRLALRQWQPAELEAALSERGLPVVNRVDLGDALGVVCRGA